MTNDYGNLELHQVLLAAMKDIDKICRENGLKYFLYAGTLSALEAVIFTSLWWGLWRQLAAWSSLIWLGGLTALLTVPGAAAAKSLMICVAMEIMVVCWIMYRRSRIPKEEGGLDENA